MAGQVHPSAPEAPMLYNQKDFTLPAPATYAKPSGRRHRGGLAGCCCCLLSTFCSLLFAFLILVGITILVLWLVLRPVHLPKYSLNDVDITNFSVVPNSAKTGYNLNSNIVYNITAENPNHKIGIKYDYINLQTSYDGQVFAQSSIPEFYQGHRNTTVLSSAVTVTDFPLQSGTNVAALQSSENNLPLKFQATAKVHVRIGKYTSPGFKVRVDCDVNVNVAVTPAQLLSKSCKLKHS